VVWLGSLIITITLLLYVVPVPSYGWSTSAELYSKLLSPANIGIIFSQFIFDFAIGILAMLLSGKELKSSVKAFPISFVFAITATIITGNKFIKGLGLEEVIFSLSLGLIVGNAFRLPEWFRSILSAELFVKIGLVLLGTSVLFGNILKAGALGLIQALAVV